MRVVNLFAGPGTGKSTTAAGIFYELKKQGRKCEYVSEYAKELVFSDEFFKLEDQLYVAAKQHRRLLKLKDKVDIIITDGPILLGNIYFVDNGVYDEQLFKDLVLTTFNSYNNLNIFLKRDATAHPYQNYGRSQTIEQALEIDASIQRYLRHVDIPFVEIGIVNAVSSIINIMKDDDEELND